MGFSIQKIMLEGALKKIGADSIKLQYIFATKKVRAIAGEKIVTDNIPSTLSDMAIKKLTAQFPNAKFLDVEVTKQKITGFILLDNGIKETINFDL
jgi:hypothetical protein